MSNGFLSQEEIDSLLNGGNDNEQEVENKDVENVEDKGETAISVEDSGEVDITDLERDLLGEIGNISMGSASTALSTIINQQVNITTPIVSVTTLKDLKDTFEVPNIALEVKYTSGIVGENLLVMKITDAAVVANLMMGGDGKVENPTTLSEIEESAVSEAMNQMIGSAATSMATMFAREVNISPPESRIWDDLTSPLSNDISEDEKIVKVSFSLTIGDLVDSNIMQILPIGTARKIVAIMMGEEEKIDNTSQATNAQGVTSPVEQNQGNSIENKRDDNKAMPQNTVQHNEPIQQPQYNQQPYNMPPQYGGGNYGHNSMMEKPIEVQQAAFQPLQAGLHAEALPKNIDLIMDVPLEISVVLGRTKLSIKEILNLGTGSLVELDRLAEEPVEILVNGKKVAYGEVVVVDENFGVRITSIVSNEEKIKSLGK
ncbi:flagellar motor switch protein FliN/FliY [Clostridium tetanomorphum]|uniref:Flagellar motor switch phosphatase FliY n=1 Tax=Clostridium tetanomorphum TaxID=1553 RepID=A0A923E8I0_CLOTT|nr:flagellar motor switch phosphatase FliY [Clostridium tetanomorphum]KAJ53495.1 flagellar motor switch protein [Clostridium tetanomorphum DSM 665]MBC2398430.1 flagellar motor switch phosphatase FliY [Clostridium tetanomorphum]MBP1865272.1 flagellar motor switch protein FliN/FliY [Clostridium tetanomorphum]NRS85195.1 flagellar motor switch protein FliN/FliY [Clostridium tetanomorphum]NRZ98374.1 flagellar motor switch protein FliN/FliY [Clostridium tetanomorphum]